MYYPDSISHVTGLILAGGASRRMNGEDKGLVALGGKPLLFWVVTALQPQVNSIVISASRNLAEYSRYAKTICDLTTGFSGPLMGIASVLASSFDHNSEWFLTAPVDCPAPPVDLSERLFTMAHSNDRLVAVAHDGTHRQPLFALYHRTLAASAVQATHNSMSVWQWQDQCDALEVDFSDRQKSFVNLNTKEEFDLFEKKTNG